MNGLIIDTSQDPAILGLLRNQEVIAVTCLEGAKKLSATLFPALQSFCTLQDLHYISVGTGPGSYMGIRTAATIAKSLAFALNIPLFDFCSPLAFLPKGKEGSFAVIGDAKMGQLYIITGFAKDSQISNLSAPLLIKPEALGAHTLGKDFVIGEDHLEKEVNLEWIAHQSHTRFIQGNTPLSDILSLTYLR